MKRIIAISLVLVIALACIPFSAFATPSANEVYSKMTAARDKVYAGKESFSAAESYDFWIYLKADGDPAAYKDAYVQSVKEAISGYTIGDAANCALAILCLQKLGFNPAEFSLGDTTVNLIEIMNSKGKDISSPYLYRYIFEAGASDGLISDCLNELNTTYVAGVGNDPWGYGYSCDTNASLGVCYATNEVDYDKAEDLANTLSAYKLEDGYFSDNMWTTVANVDSTACALCLFSYMGEIEKANEAYTFLANFAVEGEEGAYFASYDPGVYNAYGTRDALLGLIEYYKLVAALPHVHAYTDVVTAPTCTEQGYTTHTCECGDVIVDTYVSALGHKWDSGKVTKKATPTATGIKTYTCKVCKAKKTEKIAKCAKYANTIVVKGKKATVSFAKLKKANQTIARNSVLSISKAQGKLTYAKVSGNKNIGISKSKGIIQVKKGLKKGTYKIGVKVTAAGNASYKSASKKATITVVVK